MNKGIIYAAAAYFMWGVFPIFWKSLHHVPAYEILGHRMLWTFLFTAMLMAARRDYKWLRHLGNLKILATFILTACIIAMNWFVFIWAVNHNFIVEASLGYFINPLINVLFGVVFLKERMRKFQFAAILIALAGVLYLTFNYGSFPSIALFLATSFAFYGLLRKTAYLNSLQGLTLETGFLFIPALIYLLGLGLHHHGALFNSDLSTGFLLFATGAITAFPLLLFASGARRITFITLGLLQYIAPTLQFLIGVFVYHENFPRERLTGFMIIWIALVLYTSESILTNYKYKRLSPV